MMQVNSDTTVTNVTLVSSIPSQALTLGSNAANIRLLYLTILDMPAVNMSDSGHPSIKRNGIDFGQNNSHVEIAYCRIMNVGYGIIMDHIYYDDVHIHHNFISNVSADGICLNTPAFGTENGQVTNPLPSPYYSIGYTGMNLNIHDNVIAWTGWSTFGTYTGNSLDQSFGFGLSFAGGWNITIARNQILHTTWQAIHVEAHAHYMFVTDNVIDTVYNNPQTGYWQGYFNGIWFANSYYLTVTGNTFSNIPASAIRLEPVPTAYCVPGTGQSSGLPCIPYPPTDYFNQYIHITQNNFCELGHGRRLPRVRRVHRRRLCAERAAVRVEQFVQSVLR